MEHAAQERLKQVRVLLFVVFPGSLRNEQGHIFLAVVVVASVPSPLNQRPEAFNRVGVYVTYCVLVRVGDDFMGYQVVNDIVSPVLVCNQERTPQADILFQELHNAFPAQVGSHLGNHASPSFNRPNDGGFLRPTSGLVRCVVGLLVGSPGLAAYSRSRPLR